MKKIAFYIESMIVGGAEKVLIDLVNHMDYAKYDVTVIAIFRQSVYDGYSCQFEKLFDPHVHYVSLIDNGKKWKYRLFNRAYAHLSKSWIYSALVKEQYDIEVAFYEGLPTEFVAHDTNSHSKKFAWLHTDNTHLYKNQPKDYIESKRKIYERYDCVIGVSDIASNSFRAFFPEIHTKTIYNLIDVETIKDRSKEIVEMENDGVMVFVTVGRLTEVKGYHRLIHALGRIKREGYQFCLYMIGDGLERKSIEDSIKENDLDECVHICGMKQNPYPYMKQADYFLCSSYIEGYSLVVAEAILCGTPVVSTNCGGVTEVFGNCECGIICPNNEDGLYDALKEVIKHPEKRNFFVNECQKRMPFFDVKTRMREIEKLWECR